MNPITHALSGWCLAETFQRLTRRERAAIAVAAVLPDLDGLGIVAELATRESERPLLWWSEYHHVLCHDLTFGVIASMAAFFIARQSCVLTALLVFVAVHLHILGDVIGSRGPDGYQWPVAYLYPFDGGVLLTWSGQWQLNAWPNVTITVVLLLVTLRLAWVRGYSIVGLFSPAADRAFVRALRQRFGEPRRR